MPAGEAAKYVLNARLKKAKDDKNHWASSITTAILFGKKKKVMDGRAMPSASAMPSPMPKSLKDTGKSYSYYARGGKEVANMDAVLGESNAPHHYGAVEDRPAPSREQITAAVKAIAHTAAHHMMKADEVDEKAMESLNMAKKKGNERLIAVAQHIFDLSEIYLSICEDAVDKAQALQQGVKGRRSSEDLWELMYEAQEELENAHNAGLAGGWDVVEVPIPSMATTAHFGCPPSLQHTLIAKKMAHRLKEKEEEEHELELELALAEAADAIDT